MVTKDVHTEVVSSLFTKTFLMTFQRFIARRSNVSVVYSDNAINFLGTENKLMEVRDFFGIIQIVMQ